MTALTVPVTVLPHGGDLPLPEYATSAAAGRAIFSWRYGLVFKPA